MGLRFAALSMTAAATLLAAQAATLSLSAAQGTGSHPSGGSLAPDDQALVKRYCVSCHSDRLKTGSLTLESVSGEPVGSAPAVWEKVVRKIRSGAMPPAGRPRPEKAVKDAFAGRLEAALDENAAARPNPGRTGVHRLNRAEYANAIRDLLSLDTDVSALLPADDAAFGFDNIADMLTMSTGLLERYLSAASRISRLAVGDTTVKPTVEFYDVSRYFVQDDRVN